LNTTAKISWSSGTSCKVLKHLEGKAFVQFPSSTVGILSLNCFAIKGSNYWIPLIKLKKAGDARILGKIPKVWGIAMNPVDHPHGGWTNGGIHPRTPKGFLTKNIKTRKRKKWSNPLIFSLKI
jgi:large subunit ribosomal protein L2